MSKWDVDRALSQVEPEVDALERVRLEVLESRAQGAKKMGLVVAGSFVVGLLVMMVLNSGFGLLAGVPVLLIGGAIVHHIYYAKGTARYRSMFKVGFLAKLVKAVEPGVDYVPEQGISEAVFNQSGLFGASPDRYTCEDLIHGMIGDTKVMLSEVHAKEKHTSTDSKGRSQTRWKTMFKGIFFLADFHKEFRTPVLVMPDVAERHFGWIGKKLQKLGGNLQKMENPEFEKMFVVRGADAVETRYLLTPSMQDRLVLLRGRLGKDLRIVFRDSHVCLAIPNETNWFEGDLKMPAGDRTQAKMLLGQIKSCFQIIEELDLNTRIWTKE
jgi:hypothetical protein